MGWSARLQASDAAMGAFRSSAGGPVPAARPLVDRRYSAVQPPSIERIAPVIDLAASEVRKTA
jgi:hypothetical protein